MSKVAIVGYARTASTRLRNKVLYDLGGKPAFVHSIERAASVVRADYVFVATTRGAGDDPIELLAKHYGIECFRGPASIQERALSLGRILGLKDDDWWLGVYCDGVLGYEKVMPWVMEQMKKHNCDRVVWDLPLGSLIQAFNVSALTEYWKCRRLIFETLHTVEPDHYDLTLEGSIIGAEKYLIVHWAPKFLMAWPWGLVHLDFPSQAVVIKEVYRQLYKGMPIDIFDVYDLFLRDPRLAHMIPLDLPEAHNHLLPGDEHRPWVETVKRNSDFVEVTWREENYVKPESTTKVVKGVRIQGGKSD